MESWGREGMLVDAEKGDMKSERVVRGVDCRIKRGGYQRVSQKLKEALKVNF